MKKVIIAVMATAALSTQAFAAGDAEVGKSTFAQCIGCHGAAGEGGVGPKLAGQSAEDITAKLVDYKNGVTVGPMTSMMAPMATGLSEADIANISAYVASL